MGASDVGLRRRGGSYHWYVMAHHWRRAAVVVAMTQLQYSVEICCHCDTVCPENIGPEVDDICPECGAKLFGLLGTEIIDVPVGTSHDQ